MRRAVLTDVKRKHTKRDLKVAAAIVEEATKAICENIFVVDPASSTARRTTATPTTPMTKGFTLVGVVTEQPR